MLRKLCFGATMLMCIVSCTNEKNDDIVKNNPLLQEWTTPHETPPFDKIQIEHYVPAVEYALAEAKADVDAIIANTEVPTFENTIVALETSGELLDKTTSVLFNMNSAETNDGIQAATRELSPKLSEFGNYVSLNPELFARIRWVYNQKGELQLNAEQLRLLENTYKSFERSGANLTGDAKTRYAEITTELSKLSLTFGENVLAETNAYEMLITDAKDLAGLPEGVIEAAAQAAKAKEKTGWLFNLQYPSMGPFLMYAENRALRQELFIASATKACKDNEYNNSEIIKQLVALRAEKAQLLGYKSHAHYVLQDRMAKTPERVNQFIDELHAASRPAAVREYKEVEAYAKSKGFDGETLQRWDWSFYSEQLKAEKYGFNEEEIKPYFRLENVNNGIFELATRLYGITFKENANIPVYHKDVTAYEVFDADGSFLSVFYTDFFPREGKSGGAWMTSYRSQSNIDGEMIRPHVSIVCNFTKPTETKPSLLTFREVETFLHEFGHALHGMLANTIYPSMSGTSVYRDFVELPSQVMENWAPEKLWLDLFAVHYKTGEKIPEALVQKLIKSQNYLAGYGSERQLSFGMVDMAFHSMESPIDGTVADFETAAMGRTELFPKLEGAIFSNAFGHIFSGGYAAGYYGYKWAEVLDADAYAAFKEAGIYNKETATKFRKNILEMGGTEDPMELYIKFRGSEPNVDALLERSGLK